MTHSYVLHLVEGRDEWWYRWQVNEEIIGVSIIIIIIIAIIIFIIVIIIIFTIIIRGVIPVVGLQVFYHRIPCWS